MHMHSAHSIDQDRLGLTPLLKLGPARACGAPCITIAKTRPELRADVVTTDGECPLFLYFGYFTYFHGGSLDPPHKTTAPLLSPDNREPQAEIKPSGFTTQNRALPTLVAELSAPR